MRKGLMFLRRCWFKFSVRLTRWISEIFNPIAIALSIGVLVSFALWLVDGGLFSSTPPTEPSFFFDSAAFVGGALAIVVTLNTLLLQNALDKLPARSFKSAISSGRLHIMYLVMATIAISLFVSGITYIDTHQLARTYLLRVGVGLDVWALIIIFIYSQIIVSQLDPSEQITSKSKITKRRIDRMERLVKQAVKAMAENDTSKSAVEAAVRAQLQPTMRNVLHDLEDLSGMYERLLERGDYEHAMACLTSVAASVAYVYGTRKDNALAVPTEQWGYFAPKSDLAEFANKVDEILIPLWTKALESNDLRAIREILNGYTIMVNSSTTMKHVNYDRYNPLFSHTWGGFKRVFDKGLESRNEEALFQLAGAVSSIAKYYYLNAPKGEHNYLDLKGILEKQQRLYEYAAMNVDSTLLTQVSDGFMGMLGVVLVKDKEDQDMDEVVVEKFADMLAIANLPPLGGLLNAGDEILAQDLLTQNIIGGVAAKNTSLVRIRNFIRAANIVLGSLSKAFSKQAPHIARINFKEFFKLSGEAALMLLHEPPKKLTTADKDQLSDILSMNVSLHETAIKSFDYSSKHEGEDYSRKLSMIGQIAASYNDTAQAIKIINSLMKMATWLLENKATGRGVNYVVYRMAHQAAYIAGIAHAQRRFAVARHYRDLLYSLEDLWIKVVFPDGIPAIAVTPSPNIFRGMFDDALNGFGRSGIVGVLEYPEDTFMQYVNLVQIESFDAYLWRNKPVVDPVNHPYTPSRYFFA